VIKMEVSKKKMEIQRLFSLLAYQLISELFYSCACIDYDLFSLRSGQTCTESVTSVFVFVITRNWC